jgi:hypothetical protein
MRELTAAVLNHPLVGAKNNITLIASSDSRAGIRGSTKTLDATAFNEVAHLVVLFFVFSE